MSVFNPGGPTLEQMGVKPESETIKYQEKASVNGKDIGIHWDSGYEEYVVYFPQVKFGDETSDKYQIYDNVILIGTDTVVAQQIFAEAIKLAETEPDVYGLYKGVERFAAAHVSAKEEETQTPEVLSDVVKLNEENRSVIEAKLREYSSRLDKQTGSIEFTAPELMVYFVPFYDAVAKIAAADALLKKGTVSLAEVEEATLAKAKYGKMSEHAKLIKQTALNAWGVIKMYNEGEL